MADDAGTAHETEINSHVIGRLADSSEGVVRDLVALPLRMLAEGLGVFEAVLRAAADAISEADPGDDPVVKLERRLDSLEEQVAARREGLTTPSTPTPTV